MSTRIFLLLATIGLVVGCTNESSSTTTTTTRDAPPDQPIAPPSTQMTTLTGTLQGGMMAIGGETTGWTLVGDGAVGGAELDVSKVNEDAKRLDGKRVTVSGLWKDKEYVERGRVRILAVDKIAEAK